jgi:hypothetical protein
LFLRRAVFLALPLVVLVAAAPPFHIRTDPAPKQWRTKEFKALLPFWWEQGTVYLLAWEKVADDRPFEYTQVLVLKHFDQPTKKGGHRWALTHLFYDPKDRDRPWQGTLRILPPVSKSEPMPKLSEAQLYGWSFYAEPPTDGQLTVFLRETDWTPALGLAEDSAPRVTTRLAAGGVDPAAWKQALGRDVPAHLFPELRVGSKRVTGE